MTCVKGWDIAPLTLAVFLAACVPSDAAEAGDAGSPDVPTRHSTVPRGTSLGFLVDETVSIRTHRPGDVFTSTLAGTARGLEGEGAIPAGSKGYWRVVEATADGGHGASALRVVLEAMEIHGSRYAVSATVVPTGSDVGAGAALIPFGSKLLVRLDQPLTLDGDGH